MSRPILSKPPLFTGCVAKLGGTKKKLDCQAHSPPLWLERLRQLSDHEREPPRSFLRRFSTPQGRTGRRAPDGEHTPGCADGTAVGWDHVEFPGKATDSANDRCSSGERVFFRRRGTSHQGASGMWVCSNISSLALVYCSQRRRDSRSIRLSFHCLSG